MNYKSLTLLAICIVSWTLSLLAQKASVKYETIQLAPQYTPVQLATIHTNDSIIMHDIVTPMVDSAVKAGLIPDWLWIGRCIEAKKYSAYYADKNVARAKIFYNWGKDWPAFATAIVYFTNKYEDKSKAELMSKNAKMVLDYSINPAELKSAANWVKDTDKSTHDALLAKAAK